MRLINCKNEINYQHNYDIRIIMFQLQEMRGNIRVFARCRYDDRVDCCLEFPSDREMLLPTGKKSKFDYVFKPESKQTEV